MWPQYQLAMDFRPNSKILVHVCSFSFQKRKESCIIYGVLVRVQNDYYGIKIMCDVQIFGYRRYEGQVQYWLFDQISYFSNSFIKCFAFGKKIKEIYLKICITNTIHNLLPSHSPTLQPPNWGNRSTVKSKLYHSYM